MCGNTLELVIIASFEMGNPPNQWKCILFGLETLSRYIKRYFLSVCLQSANVSRYLALLSAQLVLKFLGILGVRVWCLVFGG